MSGAPDRRRHAAGFPLHGRLSAPRAGLAATRSARDGTRGTCRARRRGRGRRRSWADPSSRRHQARAPRRLGTLKRLPWNPRAHPFESGRSLKRVPREGTQLRVRRFRTAADQGADPFESGCCVKRVHPEGTQLRDLCRGRRCSHQTWLSPTSLLFPLAALLRASGQPPLADPPRPHSSSPHRHPRPRASISRHPW